MPTRSLASSSVAYAASSCLLCTLGCLIISDVNFSKSHLHSSRVFQFRIEFISSRSRVTFTWGKSYEPNRVLVESRRKEAKISLGFEQLYASDAEPRGSFIWNRLSEASLPR